MIDVYLLFLCAAISIVLYLFLNKNTTYWRDRKVPYIQPYPILGNLKSLLFLEKSVGDYVSDLHNSVEGAGHKFLGFYLFNCKPALLIRDPELVKLVLVKDFNYFFDRNMTSDEKKDPVGFNNLFALRGEKWKFLRTKLTPSFSSGKIKQMFLLMKEVAGDLLKLLEDKMEKTVNEERASSAILESKTLMARFTMDVVNLTVFGINSGCLTNEKSKFKAVADSIFELSIKRAFNLRCFFFAEWLTKVLPNSYTFGKEGSKFFREVYDDAMVERSKRKIYRNDFLDTLMDLKEDQEKKLSNQTADKEEKIYRFEGDFLLAQPVLFFTAGFESASTTLSMSLYELALNTYVQDKLRQEITDCIGAKGEKLTYEAMSEMTYMDKVIAETLRKYPTLPFLDRVCTKNYKIPGTDVVIEKGTPVYIALFKGLHYDPENFPMPDKFDPERFSEENKSSWHPYSYLPFGEGPRSCIGKRYGLTSVKTGLCSILPHYKMEICDKTKIPLNMDNRAFMTTVKGGNYIRFVNI